MENQGNTPKEAKYAAPRVQVYGSPSGTGTEKGSEIVYAFGQIGGLDQQAREGIVNTITRLIEEHDSPHKIIYTTATGRTPEGLPYAEVVLLPVGDTIHLTLGDRDGLGALGTDSIQMRRLIIYLLGSYLATAYDVGTDDLEALCDAADEQAEADEAAERERGL